MDKVKNFIINNWKILLCVTCLLSIILVVSILLFKDDDIETSKSVSYIEELRKKDENIHNNISYEIIEGEFKGIDVSSWQGDINWEKISQSNIDFVMIRCGYRSIETDEIKIDNKFIYNISEANKYGIPVGIYFYSTAININEAVEEASYVLNLIKDYEVLFPIVYDFEVFNKYRAQDTGILEINDNAIEFMDYIEEHGYESMLYTNLHSLQYYWDYDRIKDRKIWFAQYMEDIDNKSDYHMWQYSDNGRIDGILGKVDLNESYYMYVKK